MDVHRRPPVRSTTIERLERRRLLAVVVGTAADDLIRFTRDQDGVPLVIVNGVLTRLAGATELVIDAAAGNDTIRIEDAAGLPLTLMGGAGNDRFEIGTGDLALAALTTVHVVGGMGIDTLDLNDSAAALPRTDLVFDNPHDVAVSITFGDTVLVIDEGNDADATESIVYRGGGADDLITIRSTHARAHLLIDAGGGNDTLRVEDDIDTLLNGPVDVRGGAGVDRLIVDDSADAFADTYLLGGAGTVGTLSKTSGGATITYAGWEEMELHAGMGGGFPNNQFFRVSHIPAETAATIFAGSGDDVLIIGDGEMSLADFHADLFFDGGEDRDRIVYNDAPGIDPAAYGVEPHAMARTGRGVIGHVDVEELAVYANDAANTLRVSGTAGVMAVTLHGGGGDDRFEVGGGDLGTNLANAVSVVGGAGNDTLVIGDTLDEPGDDFYTVSAGMVLKNLRAVLWSTTAADRVEHVTLNASANADTIHVTSASPGVSLRIDAGAGDDLIRVDRTDDGSGMPTPVTIVSGAGRDTIDVNADFSGSDASVVIGTLDDALGDLFVRGGGRLALAGGSDQVLTVRGTLAIGGTLDIGAASILVESGTGATATFTDRLRSGYANGAWTGAGIRSSVAAATVLTDAVGIARAGDIGLSNLGGRPVGADDVLIRYTLAGDANLDRRVDFDDLLVVAQRYGTSGNGWARGNFDYDLDGVVDFDDLLALAQTFGKTMPAAVQNSVGSACGPKAGQTGRSMVRKRTLRDS